MTIYSFLYLIVTAIAFTTESTHTASSNDTLSGQINKSNDSNSSKLLFGILYSLKTISNKLANDEETEMNELKSFTIGSFKVHFGSHYHGLNLLLSPMEKSVNYLMFYLNYI